MKLKLTYRIFPLKLLVSLLLLSNCVPYARYHDQNKAAQVARDFSKEAFVTRDFEGAFSYVSANRPAESDVSKLQELVKSMHPEDKYPIDIKADDYEIVPNSGVIKIYLHGKGKSGETHYYCIVMVPENNDYKVIELYRNEENTPYPKTPLRQPLE